MDKNGQNRGGARTGSGRKPKGNMVITLKNGTDRNIKVEAYMERSQKNGSDFLAKKVYAEIVTWLDENNVLSRVPDHLLQLYSVTMARWIQAEDHISNTGLIGKHPTTGNPMASPYVGVSAEYQKQTTAVWWQIYQMIKDSTGGEVVAEEPSNNLLSLLRKANA